MAKRGAEPTRPLRADALLWTAAIAILWFAFALRLINLGMNLQQGWDEGFYLLEGRLFGRGLMPFPVASTWELNPFLLSLGWAFNLLGDAALIGRLWLVLASLVSLALTGAVARLLSNKLGMLAAIAILALDPGYLTYSRSVYLEVPGMAFAMGALACVLVFTRQRRRRWLLIAGVSAALALLTKQVAFGLGLAFPFYTALFRWERRSERRTFLLETLQDWLVLGLGVILPLLLLLPMSDPGSVSQEFARRMAGNRASSLMATLPRMVEFLSHDAGLLWLAALGLLYGALRRGKSTLPLTAGLAVMVILDLQLIHFDHHDVVLIPPLAVLAGVGIASWTEYLPTLIRQPRELAHVNVAIPLGLLGVAAYVWVFPSLVRADQSALLADPKPQLAACVDAIRSNSAPADMVIGDLPILVYRAGRVSPPEVAEATVTSINGGIVRPDNLIQSAVARRPPVIVTSNFFRPLTGWLNWVRTRYARVATCKDTYAGLVAVYKFRAEPASSVPGE